MIELNVARPPVEERTSVKILYAANAQHSFSGASGDRALPLTRTQAQQAAALRVSQPSDVKYADSDYRVAPAHGPLREWRGRARRSFAAAALLHRPCGKSSPPRLFRAGRPRRS